MRALVFVAAMVLAVGAPSWAAAQTSQNSVSSSQLYDTCIANNLGPPLECACMAGFYGGRLEPIEFRLISVLNRYVVSTGAITNMDAAQAALRTEASNLGLSDQRFNQAMQRFATMDQDGAYGDQVCMVMRGK